MTRLATFILLSLLPIPLDGFTLLLESSDRLPYYWYTPGGYAFRGELVVNGCAGDTIFYSVWLDDGSGWFEDQRSYLMHGEIRPEQDDTPRLAWSAPCLLSAQSGVKNVMRRVWLPAMERQ